MNKLLMEENDRLQTKCQNCIALARKDTSCESVVKSGRHHHLTPQHSPRDASPAEETLTEFFSKAAGTCSRVGPMPGIKPCPDAIGIVAISLGCIFFAARTCSLVGLDPSRVVEVLKYRAMWFRYCRAVDVLNVLPTAYSGTIELLYMQFHNAQVIERSLSNTQNGPTMSPILNFVRSEMFPSGLSCQTI